MESKKNNNSNNGGGDEQQQHLRRSARKRKINELANDSKPAVEDQIQQEEGSSSKMNREENNDQDLDLEQIVQLPQPQVTGEKEFAENEEEAELPMRQLMKIQLPLENWADLLPFVPRRQLVQIVKQLGDRQFARILQFFLTKEGRITLGYLRIVAPRQNDPNGGGPIVEVHKEFWSPGWLPLTPTILETNLPEGPMPTNVKDFKLIELSYFDMSVANFLRHFQHEQQPAGNSLLDNVNLRISSLLQGNTTIMPILAQLMPMIGNINSISIGHLHHMGFEPNNAASQLLTTMLTNAKILEIRVNSDIQRSTFDWCDWLYAPRNDGKPRALRLSCLFSKTKDLIEQIKKDFLKATHPVSFFLYVYVRAFQGIFFGGGNVEWQDICVDNGQTNERLVIKTSDPPRVRLLPGKLVLISRYSIAANQEWIGANEKEIMEWDFDKQNRQIRFEQNLEQNGGNV